MSAGRQRILFPLLLVGLISSIFFSEAPPAHATSLSTVPVIQQPGCATRQTNVLIQRDGARLQSSNDREVITVAASDDQSTTALLSLWRRTGSCYVLVDGPWRAEIGSAGLKVHKSEGDGSTPVGTYSIGPVMYGVSADPGLAYPYHHIACGDWWDEDSSSTLYNKFVHIPCGTSPPFGGDSEALWQITPQYDYFAVVDYNLSPIVAGRGSAIFIHVSIGEPTSGCIALPLTQLLTTLRWLQPSAHPLIVIGTT